MTQWADDLIAFLGETSYANNVDVLGLIESLDASIGEVEDPAEWVEGLQNVIPPGADKALLDLLALIAQIAAIRDAICHMAEAVIWLALGFPVDLGCDD